MVCQIRLPITAFLLCIPPNISNLTLQVDASNIEEMILTDIRPIVEELRRFNPDSRISWGFTLVHSSTTFEDIAAGNERWNSLIADTGCIQLGGPIILAPETDTLP